ARPRYRCKIFEALPPLIKKHLFLWVVLDLTDQQTCKEKDVFRRLVQPAVENRYMHLTGRFLIQPSFGGNGGNSPKLSAGPFGQSHLNCAQLRDINGPPLRKFLSAVKTDYVQSGVPSLTTLLQL